VTVLRRGYVEVTPTTDNFDEELRKQISRRDPGGKAGKQIGGQLNRALNEVLANPQVVARFERQGARVEAGPPSALRDRVRHELDRWQGVVAEGGLAPQDIRLLAVD